MSYPNQYAPPGQYNAYGTPPPQQQQQQWGQPPPQAGYGGYPPPGAPPPPQQGGYAPSYGAAPGYPQSSASPQPGYGAPPPAQHGGYAPPPQQPGAYPPYGAAPPGGAPPAPNYASHPPQAGHAPPTGAPPPPAPYGTHPQQPYGAPPQQPYGAPPQQPYGAPPQQPYGAPPPHQPYGTPPPQGYSAPPPQQPWSAPPVHQGPPVFLGVPVPPPPPSAPMTGPLPGFDAHKTAEAVRKAMKGFGTDEKALTAAIAPLDAFQVDALRRTFETTAGKDLVKTIEKETASWYENSLRAKVLGPVLFDCWLIHRACDGAGTHENILTEVLLDRTNNEMQILKTAYRATYGRDLATIIRSELSVKTERLFNMALVGNREEGEYVDQARVQADTKALYKAGEGKAGTDEVTICSIIATRSPAHLRALAQAYPQQYKRKLSKAIDREFSGHMDGALQFVASGAEGDGYGVQRDAGLIEEAMAGMGTKDERLIYRVIRAHWNRQRFEAIKVAYKSKYGKSLLTRVRGETGGDYRDFMCAVIGN